MSIPEEMLKELLKDDQKPEDMIGENGLLKELTTRLMEKAMGGGARGIRQQEIRMALAELMSGAATQTAESYGMPRRAA